MEIVVTLPQWSVTLCNKSMDGNLLRFSPAQLDMKFLSVLEYEANTV